MRTVYKYPLETAEFQTISMPKNAILLTLQTQNFKPTIWAAVDSENELVDRHFQIVGTGNPMPDNFDKGNYIGTWQEITFIGLMVWHLFEVSDESTTTV